MLLKMGVETETRIRRTVAADEPGVAGLIPIL
jgi:hypothetical protein